MRILVLLAINIMDKIISVKNIASTVINALLQGYVVFEETLAPMKSTQDFKPSKQENIKI